MYIAAGREKTHYSKQIATVAIGRLNNTFDVFNTEPLLVAALLGGWNEDYAGDVQIIEELSGGEYSLFIGQIRNLYETGHNIAFNNKTWKINNRISILQEMSKRIFDEHIDKFFLVLRKQVWRYILNIICCRNKDVHITYMRTRMKRNIQTI